MKKAFILYQDQEEIFNKLSNEEAGQLIKAIFQYNNGETPKLEKLLDLVFTPIKQNLDRDTVKWNNAAERSRKNGLLGGRPKNPAGYNDNLENPVGFSGTQNNPEEPRKPVTVTATVKGKVT